MAIKLSGINSGLDTDSIVQALVSSYSLKKTNLEKAQTKLSWTQDAWKDMNKKVYNLYSGKLSNMRFSAAFTAKSASVSNSSIAKVTASSGAVNGNQSLVVKQLASSGYMTGAVISAKDESGNATKVKGSTKLSDIKGMENFAEGGKLTVKGSADAEEKTVTLKSDMTVNEFITSMKSAGLSISFDENNQRIFVNSKKSGSAGEFVLEGADGDGTGALKALGLLTAQEASNNYAAIANWTDGDVTNQAKAEYNSKLAAANSSIKTLLETNEKLKKENETKLSYKKEYANMYADTFYGADGGLQKASDKLDGVIKDLEKKKEEGGLSEAELEEVNERLSAAKEVLGKLASDTIVTSRDLDDEGNSISEIDKYISGIQKSIDSNESKIAENKTKIADTFAEFGETYDESVSEIVTSYETNLANDGIATGLKDKYLAQRADAQVKTDEYNAAKSHYDAGLATDKELELLGLGETAGSSAVRIKAQDAVIKLNGATFTSDTNNFSINGLTIQALSTNDESSPVTITTDTDVDGIYNTVKNFFKEYNEMIKYMDEKYNAAGAGGYEPLTDEEKEAMSDSEIEKWETKIKDSLLRKDSTLSTITNIIKNDMAQSFTVGDKKYNLASFGIKTLNYFTAADNEKGVYHIDGDADDSATSGESDKLRAAIASDPDTFISFFTQLSSKVYNDLTKKMASSSMSSAYTLYNDKQMKNEYSSYKTQISSWEEKITDKEDFYYKKFSAMEKALSKLNSQQSQMTGYFG